MIRKRQLRPAIFCLVLCFVVCIGGILCCIFLEDQYKGTGIIFGTVGFLGSFALSLFLRRKHKILKVNQEKLNLKTERQNAANFKQPEIVDPLMMRAITHFHFRGCDELRGQGEEDKRRPLNRTITPVSQCDYVVINSSPVATTRNSA